eukprot:TRINITY_DN25148_c0_g2_i1.p1 TRINITY_DN25148_c0_g2~~TRINITY_DN25148_c0_g2_i1.p1  ORF type:complete len:720 (+),score=149.97 TRINITY_DN25148_c0_g2_i1:25-2160(+)
MAPASRAVAGRAPRGRGSGYGGRAAAAEGSPKSTRHKAFEDAEDPLDVSALRKPKLWYGDRADADKLRSIAIEAASVSVKHVAGVCEALATALALADTEEEHHAVQVGSEKFSDRVTLKAKCQGLLKTYADDELLEKEDAEFMLNLLAYHPRGIEKALGCQGVAAGVHPTFSTRCFYVVRKDGREDFSYIRCIDNAPTFEVECKSRICEAISSVLQVHPAATQVLASHIEERFPYLRGPTCTVERHRNWATAVLMLCTRMPAMTEFLLVTLVRRMVQIDTEVNRLESSLPDEVFGDGGKDGEVRGDIDRMAQILDCNMMLCFEFMQRHLAGAVEKKTEDDKEMMMGALVSIFTKVVMQTHKVRCVQFLWFYLASLRPCWTEAFLSQMLHTLYGSEKVTVDKRMLAVSYLASFVARAGFLPLKYALRTTQYIAQLARTTLQAAENGQNSPAQLRLLLGMVQATCYMLCWWAEAFAQEEEQEEKVKGITCLDTILPQPGQTVSLEWNFMPVLESPHGPVARIRRVVAREFCRRIRPYRPQLHAALKQQLREVPPPAQEDESEPSQTFFPFDPYRLRHSNMFLMGLYRSWLPNDDEESDEFEDSDAEERDDGFAKEKEDKSRARAMSVMTQSSEVDGEVSDADFTDEADVQGRGFIPSVGPSPAFVPRSGNDMAISPLIMPMCSLDQSDNFALPSASIDADHMSSMLQNPAYRL